MTVEGNIKVIVICQSELILNGFAGILKNSIANEIIVVCRSEELIDFPDLKGQILVITTKDEEKKSGQFIRRILSSVSNIRFLHFDMNAESDHSAPTININDSPSLIVYKTDEILKAFISEQNINSNSELTRRETEVLRLVAKGYMNKEIAEELFVSTHTVISHRKNITEKTGIKSASGLTMYAILKKIIDVKEINPDELI